MTQGPIEFLSDSGPVHEVPDTEFGGADGIIQPENDTRLQGDPDASGGNVLGEGKRHQVSEVLGIMNRRAVVPLTPREAVTGVIDGEDVVDPVTGRTVPPDANKKGGNGQGELSDLAPY